MSTLRSVCLTGPAALGNGEAIVYCMILFDLRCGGVVAGSLWLSSGLEVLIKLVVITISSILAIALSIHSSRDFLQ